MTQDTEQANASEFELLTLCARKVLSEGQASRVAALVREDEIRWTYVLRLAGYHGIQPLLYAHLRTVGGDAVPDEVVQHLRAVVGRRSLHSLILVNELGRLAKVFDRAGLPLVAVKGPALAHAVYGNIALRPFVDLDLVIERGRYDEVEALLRTEGYDASPLSAFQKSSYLFIHGQYTFWRRIDGLGTTPAVLDIHTAIMPPGYSYTEDFGTLFARTDTLSMGGADVRVFQREDLLEILCYHGLKNRWDRIKYFTDVAEVLRAYPDLDWDTVLGRASAMNSERVLRLGLTLVQRLLDAPVPAEIERYAERDERVQRLATAILDRLPRQMHLRTEPYMDRVRLNLLAQDGILGGLRYGAYAAARRFAELYIPENK